MDAEIDMLLWAFAISVVLAITCQLVIRRFWLATFVSTVLASWIFWKFVESHFGWFDRQFFENAIETIAVTSVTSFAVGKFVAAFFERGSDKSDKGPGSN